MRCTWAIAMARGGMDVVGRCGGTGTVARTDKNHGSTVLRLASGHAVAYRGVARHGLLPNEEKKGMQASIDRGESKHRAVAKLGSVVPMRQTE